MVQKLTETKQTQRYFEAYLAFAFPFCYSLSDPVILIIDLLLFLISQLLSHLFSVILERSVTRNQQNSLIVAQNIRLMKNIERFLAEWSLLSQVNVFIN